ncbi:MAG: hypothetical protein RQ856_04340 [Candidatus Izemoplasmatales bacterium]|nr:hypothetical protein [Candidatus Izemoplasmatales bacterium]
MGDYKVISFIGNVKNAGKTTVMNSYLKYLDSDVAITSIGLDGEEIDQVTLLEKPQIFVKQGNYIATAIETLANFTCKYEVLKETNINTSIGKVVIVKVLSEGKALVAGPAKVNEMVELINHLNSYQLSKILIDGAFSRQVFVKISQAVVLVIGANYSRNIDLVVKDASLISRKLSLQVNFDYKFYSTDKISLIDFNGKNTNLRYSSIIGNVEDFFSNSFDNIKTVCFPKSLTNLFVEKLISERKRCKFNITIDSAVNIQIRDDLLEKLFKLENKIYVVNPINLAVICYNPFSPKGYEFNDEEFKDKLELALNREVINVLKDGSK